MRLPKFRCKNNVGNWCFFTVLHNGNVNEENFDLSTLSEFTGLLDKQGVEIYEGDLLHNPHAKNYCYPVEWNEVQAGFTLGGDLANMKPYAVSTFWEVIGNIVDDIELRNCNEQ